MGRAVGWAVGLVVATVLVLLVWFAISGARAVINEAEGLTTGAPAAADRGSMESDVRYLVITIETSNVDNPGTIPSVTLGAAGYTVTGANGDAQVVPAAAGVTDAGITGTTPETYCVWIADAHGTVLHSTSTSGNLEGGC